jgi:quercetin dioxygenase-like cupin family protein
MEQLNVGEMIEFSAAKRVRKKLLASKRIVGELLCYEPGQSTPLHQHPQQDECFFVVEGTGTLTVGDEVKPIRTTDLILVPAQVPHSLVANGGGKLVLLFFKAPAAISASIDVASTV